MPPLQERPTAFSLIEVLIVIAVIGIMSALIVTSITNAAADSRMVLARQQQAVLQNALNAWISAATSGTGSVAAAQTAYNAAGDKLSLVQDYLQAGTYDHFREFSSGNTIRSEAMQRAGVSVSFSGWQGAEYPKVIMN
jgi:prepilin-type N-terminal cleavage/methylation domain-containing protein